MTPAAGAGYDVEAALRSDAAPELRLNAHLFEGLFGNPASTVIAGPGGLTLFGRPDDRFALAMPVSWGAIVAAAPRPDEVVEICSGGHTGPSFKRPLAALGQPGGWAESPVRLLSSVLAAGHPLGGMSLLVSTGLPDDLGLQFDGGLLSVLATAVTATFGVGLSLAQRATLGNLAAQLASSSCPDGTAVLVDTWQLTFEVVPCHLVWAELRLMMIDLREPVEPASSGYPDLAPAAAEALRAGEVRALGGLLDQTGVPSSAAALVAEVARAAGAVGAGTLPGGCLTALVPAPYLSAVRSAVVTAWPGDRPPKFLTALSSRGGRPLPEPFG